MFSTDFGMRVMEKIRVMVTTGAPVVRVGLIAAPFDAADIETPADLIGIEASYRGYARQSPGVAWSAVYLSSGRPTIICSILVWLLDPAAPWVLPSTLPGGGEEGIAFIDGDGAGLSQTLYGYFLLFDDAGVESIIDAKAFTDPVTLTESVPRLQFAPAITFKRSCV